jgi:signal transduction histidine kinase
MQKTFNLFSFLLEFSHFLGTREKLFSELKTQLKCMGAEFFVFPSASSKSLVFLTLKEFFSKSDHLVSLFPIAEFPSEIKTLLKIKPHHQWAIPIRHPESVRTIFAFLLLPSSPPDLLQTFQILASIAGHKMALLELKHTEDTFLKHYHLGLLCPELFHEIKNKLIAPKIFLQTFPEKFEDPQFRNHFSKIAADEIERIQQRLEQFLNFSSPSDASVSLMLPQIIEQCLSILSVEIQKNKIHLRTQISECFALPTPMAQTREIVFNVLLNAIQAMKDHRGKRILSIFTQRKKKHIQLRIEDTGKGMNAEELRHVFQPYFTTKKGGSGLGLSTSKAWIENAGGTLSLHSVKNKGTTVTASFILAD